MRAATRSLSILQRRLNHSLARDRTNTFTTPDPPLETDSCGIPLQPTWAVKDVLSSLASPKITPATMTRLHRIAALVPAAEGTADFARLTNEMEQLIRLVEAVKLVDTSRGDGEDGEDIPDGRIWAEGMGIELSEAPAPTEDAEAINGRKLLSYSSRSRDGLYIVDVDRTR